MPRLLQFSVVSFRDLLTTYGPVVLIVGLLLWAAYAAIDPTPPDKVIIATGLEGSAYEDFAQRYAAVLAKHHIQTEIRQSEGSMQNLYRLDQGKSDADVAFVQSGTTNDDDRMRSGLVSLGSLFIEPVWIFYREAALAKVKPVTAVEIVPAVPQAISRARVVKGGAKGGEKLPPPTAITQLGELRGLSLNVGPKYSGGPRLANQLFEANRIQPGAVKLSQLDDTPAVMKLLDGSLDAVMFVTAPEAPMVQMLLQTPGIGLLNFDQAEAYSRRFPFLTHVVLPRGIVALEKDLPHEDVHLIAPTATLVAKSSTHPAIIELLMEAATEVHGGAGTFRKAGEFPNDQYTEIPVSPVAQRFYKNGPPFLQRYLPFWLANLIERMGVIIVPIIALLIPVSRILPPLYTWRVRSRVYRWYGQLRAVENDVDQAAADPERADGAKETRRTKQLGRLAEIESKVNRLVVPLSYADELYTLKLHIDRVRAKLLGGGAYRAGDYRTASEPPPPADGAVAPSMS